MASQPSSKSNPSEPASEDCSEVLRVAIVGGGLGGLALALALSRHHPRLRVAVSERDRRFGDRRQGYGMTLTNNPRGPLAKLGVRGACVAADCLSTCHWTLEASGEVLGYYGRALVDAAPPTAAATDSGNLRIPRQDLRAMLLERLPDTVSLRWGRRLVDYTEGAGAVALRWEVVEDDGAVREEEEEVDLLVGADGLRSRVRALRDARGPVARGGGGGGDGGAGPPPRPPGALGRCPLRYLGVSVILGLSTLEHPLVRRQGFYALDGTHRLFVMPFREPPDGGAEEEGGKKGEEGGARLTMWQLSFGGLGEEEALRLRTLPRNELLQEALRRTKDWFSPVQELLAATPEEEVWGTPLYDREVPSPALLAECRHAQDRSRVTVLGDAAHAMSMFKGQGANQALEDAVALAAALGPEGKKRVPLTRRALPGRLRRFEREMFARAAPKVAGSRAAAAHYHSPAALDVRAEAVAGGLVGAEARALVAGLRARGVRAGAQVGPRELEAAARAVLHTLCRGGGQWTSDGRSAAGEQQEVGGEKMAGMEGACGGGRDRCCPGWEGGEGAMEGEGEGGTAAARRRLRWREERARDAARGGDGGSCSTGALFQQQQHHKWASAKETGGAAAASAVL